MIESLTFPVRTIILSVVAPAPCSSVPQIRAVKMSATVPIAPKAPGVKVPMLVAVVVVSVGKVASVPVISNPVLVVIAAYTLVGAVVAAWIPKALAAAAVAWE